MSTNATATAAALTIGRRALQTPTERNVANRRARLRDSISTCCPVQTTPTTNRAKINLQMWVSSAARMRSTQPCIQTVPRSTAPVPLITRKRNRSRYGSARQHRFPLPSPHGDPDAWRPGPGLRNCAWLNPHEPCPEPGAGACQCPSGSRAPGPWDLPYRKRHGCNYDTRPSKPRRGSLLATGYTRRRGFQP